MTEVDNVIRLGPVSEPAHMHMRYGVYRERIFYGDRVRIVFGEPFSAHPHVIPPTPIMSQHSDFNGPRCLEVTDVDCDGFDVTAYVDLVGFDWFAIGNIR